MSLPEIVLFGDSLTEWGFDEYTRGFGWFFVEKYEGKAKVVNEGVAGCTSTLLKPRFRDIIKRSKGSNATKTLLFTIFVGANDACLPPSSAHVPLPKFEDNVREFVETILGEEQLQDTKIVIITPPPINIPDPDPGNGRHASARTPSKEGIAYRTYMSKKRYGEKMMEIVESYESSSRVAGLNLWKHLIDAALSDQGRLGKEDAYHEDRLPGCGLETARAFKSGYFTDGLHMDGLGYDVLSLKLYDLVIKRWPELDPEKIEP
ncbi:SGNH hydrolase-type esterase domain-containing protein [Clohesyomyces aquaticus]|uniref:SGNH hydrolase-type esterase domain-containing protein n=1 Tax=Clohesyomyces aquaticus TaxID=1231657 RepID=A0A1Y2A2I6_9PLEO|nr:SGNH hydrolase-type esterase domain-containing protein [Clohesyomyces aquaticus]